MLLTFSCVFCGPRDESEFTYGGEPVARPGPAAEVSDAVVFSIDHHRGSEENQPGWEHHEADLVDPEAGRIDTLLHWRKAIACPP